MFSVDDEQTTGLNPLDVGHNPDLNSETITIKNNFRRRGENGEIKVTEPLFTGGRLLWQRVDYGDPPKSNGLYRGYVMPKVGDIPKALQILDEIGLERKVQGKNTSLKWLIKTYPRLEDFTKKLDYINNESTDRLPGIR